jgi:DNA repair exonuclease SbcCD ATPase subunit
MHFVNSVSLKESSKPGMFFQPFAILNFFKCPSCTLMRLSVVFRASRVQKAKDRGQLLVFSPTMRNPAALPPDLDDASPGSVGNADVDATPSSGQVTTAHSPSIDTPSEQENVNENQFPSCADSMSLENMELNVSQSSSGKSQVTATTSGEDSAHLTSELKVVKETLARLESWTVANSKIGGNNAWESNLRAEREKYLIEKTQLEAKIASMNQEHLEKIAGMQEKIQGLKMQVADLQRDKKTLSKQLSIFESDTTIARSRLAMNEKMLEAMRKEWDAEQGALKAEAKQLEEINKVLLGKRDGRDGLSIELEALRAKNKELAARIASYEAKVDSLEKQVLPELESQLAKALTDLNVHTKVAVEATQKISGYEEKVADLLHKLNAAHREREEERTNFQTLNKDSSQAFDMMQQEITSKNAQIAHLQSHMGDISKTLDKEKTNLDEMSKELESARSDVDSRIRPREITGRDDAGP